MLDWWLVGMVDCELRWGRKESFKAGGAINEAKGRRFKHEHRLGIYSGAYTEGSDPFGLWLFKTWFRKELRYRCHKVSHAAISL